jgi:phosphodiesterase/alkaline phosphatase D-like protein
MARGLQWLAVAVVLAAAAAATEDSAAGAASLRGAAAIAGADAPVQVHVMYAGNPTGTGMIVSYMTQATTATSTVRFGLAPSFLNGTATGYQTSYLVTWHHHVRITGLQPNTRYYYSCGDAAAGMSPVYSFVTANPAPAYPYSVAVFGDAGIPGAGQMLGDLARVLPNISFTWHIGDISYVRRAGSGAPLQRLRD